MATTRVAAVSMVMGTSTKMTAINRVMVMKTFLKLSALAAVAATALVSCQVETFVPEEQGEVHITVKAVPQDFENETRTYIDNTNTIIWGTGEYMTIGVLAGETTVFATSSDDSANIWDGDSEAYFEFSLTPGETTDLYTYVGMYPASAAIDYNAETPYNNNKNAAAFKVSLPSTQTATASSYDPSAYIMVAKPESFTEVQDEWTASYRRATALNKVTLTNIPEDIVSVEFTAPDEVYMAGRRYIDLTTGDSGDLYGDTRTETIEVRTNLTGESKVVWFTSWETEIPVGSTFKIVAKSATKSYTRTLTVANKSITFKEGYLNTLKVNMATADVEDLENYAGNYIIGTKPADKWILMTSNNSNNYYTSLNTDVTVAPASVSDSDFSNVDDYIWAVSKVQGGYAIKSLKTGKYIALTTEGNYANESDSPVAFSLVIAADHKATVKSNSFTDRVLQYNSGSPRFAFYTGTQKDIYMIPAVVDERETLTLAFDESAINLTPDETEDFTGQDVKAYLGEDEISGLTFTYSFDGDSEFGDVNENTGVVSLSGEAGTATVTASFDGNDDYKPATASYTITVTDESGPKWVLIDDANDLEPGEYVITWDNTYYLPNTTLGKKFPVGTGISVNNDCLSNVVTEAMIWTFDGNNGEGFTVYSGSNYLQAANSSDGISVEKNPSTPSKWKGIVDATNGMLLRGNDGGTRNAAVYQNQDWRYYQTGSNYKGTLRLYKLVDNTTWVLNSIEITKAPAKTIYREGASFDPTGMEVTAHYVDENNASNTKDVVVAHSSLTITPSGALSTSDTYVTISFGGKSVTQAITVTEASDDPIVISWSRSGTTDTVTGGYELLTNDGYPETKTDYYQDKGTADSKVNYLILQSTNRGAALFSSTPSSIVFSASLRGGSAKDPMDYPAFVCLVDANGNDIASTVTELTTSVTASFADYSVLIPITGVTTAYGVKLYHTKESSWNLRYAGMTLTIN